MLAFGLEDGSVVVWDDQFGKTVCVQTLQQVFDCEVNNLSSCAL
jgi:hypothetical protein